MRAQKKKKKEGFAPLKCDLVLLSSAMRQALTVAVVGGGGAARRCSSLVKPGVTALETTETAPTAAATTTRLDSWIKKYKYK